MQGKADQLRKRQLFEAWLTQYQRYSTAIWAPGESIDVRGAVARIALAPGSVAAGVPAA
ncbi:hypothetical protein ACFSC4_24705 [Deinococcus malanensis]|uniref:hypothetical protein n=1 Tax=Deinococcus malanensis TaxID=1706855 RepID=UPI00362FAA8B